MNKVASPDQFAADQEADSDWTYGTRVERPLQPSREAGPDQQLDHPSSEPRTDSRPAPQPNPDRKDSQRPDRDSKHEEKHSGKKDERPEESEPPPPPPSRWVFAIVGLVLVGLLGWGAYNHWRLNGNAEDTQNKTLNMVPEVRTTAAKQQDAPIDLTLPGQTEAIDTANIFPRATGYITVRKVDIGSRVKKGDLLLHIAAPDLDQQLAQAVAQVGQVLAAEQQAQAQVSQAQANLNLAKVTLARTNSLTQQGYETLQNRDNQTANQASQQAAVDTAEAGVKVAQANIKAQQATVDRLKALTAFEDVTAPFDGVITTRNVDLGDLVNADSASTSPIFAMARDDVVRVRVQVPQSSAIGVRDGLEAKIEVPQMPGQVFTGKVARSSVALISSARTLSTEVDIPNPDGRLRPGLYVYLTIEVPRQQASIVVPAEALIFNQNGLQVAVVDRDAVKMHQIKIYRDYGTKVEISEGLDGGEQVVLSPPATLQDGAKVKATKADDKNNQNGGTQAGGSQGSGDPGEAAKKKDADQG